MCLSRRAGVAEIRTCPRPRYCSVEMLPFSPKNIGRPQTAVIIYYPWREIYPPRGAVTNFRLCSRASELKANDGPVVLFVCEQYCPPPSLCCSAVPCVWCGLRAFLIRALGTKLLRVPPSSNGTYCFESGFDRYHSCPLQVPQQHKDNRTL